jgi:hypothetical protein
MPSACTPTAEAHVHSYWHHSPTWSTVQVQRQDIPTLALGVARVSQARRVQVWNFCTANVNSFKALVGGSDSYMDAAIQQVLADIAAGFASTEMLGIVTGYFHTVFADQRDLPQFVIHALDEIRQNIRLKQLLSDGLCTML